MTMYDWSESPAAGRAVNTIVKQGVGQTGLIGAVRVASTAGWRNVRSIVPGDRVLTFDSGMQPVLAVHSHPLWDDEAPIPASLWPVEVPAGALGNRDMMFLAADQAVLVESDAAEALTGDPFALIPARSLDGVRGMCRVPPPPDAHITILQFASEQIVFANSGAMFHCPPLVGDLLNAVDVAPHYRVLDMEAARMVAQALEAACAMIPWQHDASGEAIRF
jgi:hypothetical protein